jgi:hypothetical protein
MKALYTILFFLDTLLLVLLSYKLFRLIDNDTGNRAILLVLSGMAVSILFLLFFMLRYLNEGHSRKDG